MEGSRFESFGGHSSEYWLRNCHGFEVRSEAGYKRGVVTDVLFETRSDSPDFLVVQRGIIRVRQERIPVDTVESISAREQRIVVREDA